ncbi:MAG: hypothetical protein AAF652_19615 [Cyanobacteria bacterium P01_C01_bin.72]
MTVGNFSEVIGTDGFDSIRGEDLSIVYGVDDGDNLNSSLSRDERNTIVVGGSGDNNYVIFADATTFILENSDSENILYTNIGGDTGISLEDDDSFVAEIDDRHLYLGNRASEQYIVIIDWQLPENQIETFALSEGNLSYKEFAASFRKSSNYRGNLTWTELNATGEIDLDRLGLSPKTIDEDFETINERSQDLSFITSNPLETFIIDVVEADDSLGNPLDNFIFGDADDNLIRGTDDNEAIVGDEGNDRLYGGFGDDIIVGGFIDDGVGGSDTLYGGYGNDAYYISLSAGGGSLIKDEVDLDDTDALFIIAEDTDVDVLFGDAEDTEPNSVFNPDDYPELIVDPATFGDSAIEIALPEEGIVGIEKSGTALIIDLDRNGIAEAENDLTIAEFFDEEGGLGTGSMAQINNIIDTQAIADFF